MASGPKLAIAVTFNRPGKKDGDEFGREAESLEKRHGFHLVKLNEDNYRKMRDAVFESVRVHRPKQLAIFCHGLRRSLQVLKWSDLEEFCGLFAANRPPGRVRICLYACSAGGPQDGPDHGDGSIADAMRDLLWGHRVESIVYAHTTAGHTTRNPHVRVFRSPAGMGGFDLVSKRSALWRRWVSLLAHRRSALRLDFPWIEPEELLVRLQSHEGDVWA